MKLILNNDSDDFHGRLPCSVEELGKLEDADNHNANVQLY